MKKSIFLLIAVISALSFSACSDSMDVSFSEVTENRMSSYAYYCKFGEEPKVICENSEGFENVAYSGGYFYVTEYDNDDPCSGTVYRSDHETSKTESLYGDECSYTVMLSEKYLLMSVDTQKAVIYDFEAEKVIYIGE